MLAQMLATVFMSQVFRIFARSYSYSNDRYCKSDSGDKGTSVWEIIVLILLSETSGSE